MNFLGSLPKSDGRLNLIVMTEYTDVKKNRNISLIVITTSRKSNQHSLLRNSKGAI